VAQRALPVRQSTRVHIRAQALHNQAADLATHSHLIVQELHPIAQGQSLRDEMIEDQVEGTFLEEIRADVQIAGIFGAYSQSFLCEAMRGNVCVCCGEDGGLDWRVGWGCFVLVGVVEGMLRAEEERAETCWGPHEGALKLHSWRHDAICLSRLRSVMSNGHSGLIQFVIVRMGLGDLTPAGKQPHFIDASGSLLFINNASSFYAITDQASR